VEHLTNRTWTKTSDGAQQLNTMTNKTCSKRNEKVSESDDAIT